MTVLNSGFISPGFCSGMSDIKFVSYSSMSFNV